MWITIYQGRFFTFLHIAKPFMTPDDPLGIADYQPKGVVTILRGDSNQ